MKLIDPAPRQRPGSRHRRMIPMQAKDTRYGYCGCGCGEKTTVYQGEPRRYIVGHCWRGVPRKPGPRHIAEDRGYSSPCWIWQMHCSPKGYGMYTHKIEGRSRAAHRVYWEREHGPVPDGLELDHLCGQRACVNPEHLEPVTHVENIRRGVGTTLNVEQVRAIRAEVESGVSLYRLGKKYGVSTAAISQIKYGTNWKDA